jgi:hypothetical protein
MVKTKFGKFTTILLVILLSGLVTAGVALADQLNADAIVATAFTQDRWVEITREPGQTWDAVVGVYVNKAGQPTTFPVAGSIASNNAAAGLSKTTFSIADYNSVDTVTVSGTAPATAAVYEYKVIFTVTNNAPNLGGSAINPPSDWAGIRLTVTKPSTPADTTNPTVTITIPPPDGNNGWFITSPVTVSITATDPSCVTAILVNGTAIPAADITGLGTTTAISSYNVSGDGIHSITVTATDSASPSNTGAATASNNTATIKIDQTVSEITRGTPSGTEGSNGWWVSNVTVPFSATDNLSGFDPEGYTSINLPSVILSTEGRNQSGNSEEVGDRAGNITAGISTGTFNIDKTAPVITQGIATGTLGTNGWYRSAVTVPFSTSDSLSGFDADGTTSINLASKTINTQGIGLNTLSDHVYDRAGNYAPGITSTSFNIDWTAPTVIFVSTQNPVYLNSTATVSWTASDSLSGLATPDSGNVTLDTSGVGTKSVGVTATDKAGNSQTYTFNYVVRYDFSGVLQPINSDGSSVFKLGSTVPVKFQLRDADGDSVTNATARIYVTRTNSSVFGTEIETVSTSAATTSNLFRYDSVNKQYILNLGTKGLTVGTYRINIDLGDGSVNTVVIGLR